MARYRATQYQKGKTNLDFIEARDSEWQWHQLGHMQVCTLLQTDNHASTHTQPRMDVDPPRVELPSAGGGISSCRPWGHNLLTMTSVNLYVLLRCVHKEIRQLTVYCRDCWKEYSCSE